MHEWGDSGITAIILAIVVVVVLSFGVAQQARARAARYQEIRRLQSVAAEEARREEAEADAEYTSMVATRYFCAVCLNSATTRCSRCKAVRYCSSACQTVHWKQGHKLDCRAPDAPSPGSSSNGSRNFSDVFSSGSSGNGSRTLSEVSDVHFVEEPTPAELPRTTASLTENGTLVRPKKILFPYDYFVKLFNWERLKVPPCGLINCGNSCFANVVLQCLTYTRPLTAYLLEGSHGEECRRNDWCFMCELQDHVWRVRQSQSPFSPIRILSQIRNIGNHLGYGRQEDAHEFMRFAIDSMQSICLDEAGGEKSVDPRTQETTFIHHIFGGHLQSQVKCMQCLHESNRYENMMDLAVEIHGCVETLEDALTQFTAPEWLDGENKYKCDRCNAYVKARKRLTLHEAPNILTIALKRFQSGKFGKLNKRVTFPEVLDVQTYMSGKGDSPPFYRLYAVVVHVDMLNASFFGHYICYVKDSQGLWYKIDDSKVKEVDLEKVMSQRAYMLFYARSSARPPPSTDGTVPSYKVVSTPELGRLDSELQGGLKVFPAPLHLESDIPAVGGALGLHAMVDYQQVQADAEGNSQTIQVHCVSNGQIATQESNLCEIERMSSTITNDEEISVEDSGCIASSSSFSRITPLISSYRSDHVPWFPSQVCQVPDPSTVEGTECVSWDQNSSPLSDFSEVSLQACAVDKACTAKVGKRRLEDGLSPLPTPKPLDTDQLPAWPTGNYGRSLPCPSVLPLTANQNSCSVSNESWQTYDLEKTEESLSPATFSVQHRISSDQMCLPGRGDQEADESDYNEVETTDTEEEELVARAKRQHIEVDSKVGPEIPEEKSQAVEQSPFFELGRRSMDWDQSLDQTGSSESDIIFGPVEGHDVLEVISEDSSKCSLLKGGQTFFPPLGQLLLEQGLSPLQCDVVPSSGREDLGVEIPLLEKSTCENSNLMEVIGAESLPSLICSGEKGRPGSTHVSQLGSQEDSIMNFETSRAPQSISDGLPKKAMEVSACGPQNSTQEATLAPMDFEINSEQGGLVGNGLIKNELDEHTGSVPPNLVTTGQTAASVPLSNCLALDLPNEGGLVKVQLSCELPNEVLEVSACSSQDVREEVTVIPTRTPVDLGAMKEGRFPGNNSIEDKLDEQAGSIPANTTTTGQTGASVPPSSGPALDLPKMGVLGKLQPLSYVLPNKVLEVSSCSSGDLKEEATPMDLAEVGEGNFPGNGLTKNESVEHTGLVKANPAAAGQTRISVTLSNGPALDLPKRGVGKLQALSNRLPNEVQEVLACCSQDVRQEAAATPMDLETNGERGLIGNGSIKNEQHSNSFPTDPATTGQMGAAVPLSNGPALDLPNKGVLGKLQKSKPTSKPLFAPGFLNRVRTPVSESKGKLGGSAISSRALSMENEHVKVEGQIHDVVKGPPEIDQQCFPSGGSHAAVNGLSLIATKVSGPSCGNCTNCKLCNTAQLPDVNGLASGYETGNGVAPGVHVNIENIGTQRDDESSNKVGTPRQHASNVVRSVLQTPPVSVVGEHSVEPAREALVTLGQSSLGRPASGRQKQGRNETCNCGSQRKWKKCCGKSGVIEPEPGRRRLVV